MNMQDLGYWFVGFMFTWPIILFVLYVIAVQYERGGAWKLMAPFTLLVILVDVALNIVFVSLLLSEMPFKHSTFLGRREFTISDRLERLVDEQSHVGSIARFSSKQLNRFAPSGVHIRNYKG